MGYKFVTSDLKSKNGNLQWKIGEWVKHTGSLELCSSGLHGCSNSLDSLQYTYGDRWFKVAFRGTVVTDDDKFVCSEMKLVQELPVKEILVRFAIECAKRCYKNWKAFDPEEKDQCVWQAIVAADNYVKNPCAETASAARSAANGAWSAARSAAWSAAWSAESAANAAWSAESAANAAWSAARSAARSAANAAWSAEREWQQKTLNRLIREELKKQKTFVPKPMEAKE